MRPYLIILFLLLMACGKKQPAPTVGNNTVDSTQPNTVDDTAKVHPIPYDKLNGRRYFAGQMTYKENGTVINTVNVDSTFTFRMAANLAKDTSILYMQRGDGLPPNDYEYRLGIVDTYKATQYPNTVQFYGHISYHDPHYLYYDTLADKVVHFTSWSATQSSRGSHVSTCVLTEK